MKLSEIKAHVYLKKAVEPKLARVFQEPEEIKFIDYPVYTAEQMQEYAKAKILEAFETYDVDLHDEILAEIFGEEK
ncbi:hypothetical protein OGZ44_06450 [Lactococcus lactis]|uniref:hypothetical protein n=1 Tax=Lactococcus lactis TaxID=1358 RepID=UPI0024179249|nr:hypothetical protein [Lactococcus lactis]MDG4973878.1 hypothetical protein [Lactococcus lactis]